MKIPTSQDVIQRSKMHPSKVKCIYLFGSRIYGTNNYQSDWDFIMVSNNSVSNQEVRSGDFNIHILTPDEYIKLLKDHHPGAIECFYAPSEFKILESVKYPFELKIPTLRHSFSHISSNSWVKARKKISQGDYYIGIKSLFHSIRIPMFGIQLAKSGKIYDFSCANKLHDLLMSKTWTWEELDLEFRPLRNKILSDFRICTTKN